MAAMAVHSDHHVCRENHRSSGSLSDYRNAGPHATVAANKHSRMYNRMRRSELTSAASEHTTNLSIPRPHGRNGPDFYTNTPAGWISQSTETRIARDTMLIEAFDIRYSSTFSCVEGSIAEVDTKQHADGAAVAVRLVRWCAEEPQHHVPEQSKHDHKSDQRRQVGPER